MKTEIIEVRTGHREGVFDLTGEGESFVANVANTAGGAAGGDGDGNGMLNVFVPHATAGLAIIELGSGSDRDLLSVLAEVLPADDRWQHAHGSGGAGRSHGMPG